MIHQRINKNGHIFIKETPSQSLLIHGENEPFYVNFNCPVHNLTEMTTARNYLRNISVLSCWS
jgi:hypothetical protein